MAPLDFHLRFCGQRCPNRFKEPYLHTLRRASLFISSLLVLAHTHTLRLLWKGCPPVMAATARWRLHKWHRRHPVPLEESRRQLLLNMCASEWRSGHALSTLMYNTAQRRACSHPGSFSFYFFGHPTAADLSPFCHLKGSHV